MTTAESTAIEEVEPEETALLAEFDARRRCDHERAIGDWLPTWFLGKLAGIEGMREAIKDQQRRLLASCNAAENALKHRWGEDFRKLVESELARSPKKSVDYGTGSAGYRKFPAKLIVVDEKAAIDHLEHFYPGAVRTFYKVDLKLAKECLTPDIERMGVEPDGFSYIAASDVFYPDITPTALPEGKTNER